MTVELTVTSITVQPEISAANVVITPTFSSGGGLTAPILSISKNGVNIAPDELKNVDIEVPTKTSDLVNDSNFVSDANYVHTDNNYDDASVQEVAKIADKQDATDANLQTDSNTIVGAINEVNSIAKGSNQALSFDDYQAVIAAMLVSGLNAGQNLYIDKLDVPDLWVKAVETPSVPYTYVSDTQFVIDILAGTQIGYYRLALLETQKVDLTNYYTKDETDQVIEDYAEPLRTTDQNYVSDAELEVLQDTSGVNTGDETQDSLGEKIELTELETVTDTTKIAASDSAFLKWFSGLTIYTYLKGKFDSVYATIANYFSKTESDRRFVSQNGGTIYHITRWFTPNANQTASSIGNTVTITNVATNFRFLSSMVGSKFGFGDDRRIITAYISISQVTVDSPFNEDYTNVSNTGWGVYSLQYWREGDFIRIASRGVEQGAIYIFDNNFAANRYSGIGGTFDLDAAKFRFYNTTGVFSINGDTTLARDAAGIFKITDGNTALRDLKLRSLFADKIIPNSDTTGVVIRNSADTADVVKVFLGDSGVFNGLRVTRIFDYLYLGSIDYTSTLSKFTVVQDSDSNSGGLLLLNRNKTASARWWVDSNSINRFDNLASANGAIAFNGSGSGKISICKLDPETTLDVNGTTTLRDWVYLNNGTHTGDAVGDRRFKVISGVLMLERCTVAHATKGSGTWVNSSNQLSDNTDAANANNVGCQRYRSDANNSYLEVCMQTGASTYEWVIIKQNTW